MSATIRHEVLILSISARDLRIINITAPVQDTAGVPSGVSGWTLAKDLLDALQDIIHFAHAVNAAELALFFVVVYQGLCLCFVSFKP